MTSKSKKPKNNLSSHLTWLIREKPTIPPPRAEKPSSSIQTISAETLAAIEAQSRQYPATSAASFGGAGSGAPVATLSRGNSAATGGGASQARETSQQRDIPIFGRLESSGHDSGGGSTSRPTSFAHQPPQKESQPAVPVSRAQAAVTMPVLQLAKTPSNRRKLTSMQRKEPSSGEADEEDPFEPVVRGASFQRKPSAKEHNFETDDDSDDPYVPVPRKASPNKTSLLDKYTKHCADGKGTKTPAVTKKIILPTGPVESIDLTISDDDEPPHLTVSRIKRDTSARSATVTPSRTLGAEKTTLPIGPSDPPLPYSSQEGADSQPTSGQQNGGPAIQVTKAAIGSASQGPNRRPRTVVFDSDDDDLSDHSVTIGHGSAAGDSNALFNVDLPMNGKRSVSVPDIERSRTLSARKSPGPARAVSGVHRDHSPKVSLEDAMVLKSSPFHRSPSRTKRMNLRNSTPDPKDLARNLGKILSPATGKENIQSPLRGFTSLPSFNLDLSLQRKREIEDQMAEVSIMIQLYTTNKYEGSLTLVDMAMRYEALKTRLAEIERPAHGFLANGVAVAASPPPRSPEHVAIDVYATQHIVENTPVRRPLLSRVPEEQTQFVKQTQYPVGSKMSTDERVSSTIPPKYGEKMDVDIHEEDEDDEDVGNPFDMEISSPPDVERTAPNSPLQRSADKGKGRAVDDDIEEELGSSDIPDEFYDIENEVYEQARETQEPSGSGENGFNIDDFGDFEWSPEELAEAGINGTSDARSPSPPQASSDVEVLEQPPPNIFEARARHVSQFAKNDNADEDVDLDDDIMEIGTQKAAEMDMGAPSMHHPWSTDVARALKTTFKLKGFRPNQLEAINATLSGNDVFVLMPTGGGKSLCYQLPAVVSSGKTRGITFVISPLLSLMEDQVEHLTKLNIQAFMFNSSISAEAKREIIRELKSDDAATSIQLLYVTPEMLATSKNMESAMESLYRRKLIARVVIDEAHCVSQWGHDFRKDYKELGKLRSKYRGIPFMALTATATPQVQKDTMHNLSIERCKIFKQSFNRPNLSYEVRKKGKETDVIKAIIDLIKSPKYKDKCGIVYCLSRDNCSKVADKLGAVGIKAAFYHAGLDSDERKAIQGRWQKGTVKVIVATIAFGMGIDKPDVRFVIHHSIPKSLEGYYQETGRAGRDGKLSGCYLFYSSADVVRMLKIIMKGEGATEQTIEHGKYMLRQVQNYCENKTECRRFLVLSYFAEKFKPEECKKTCDNCKSDVQYTPRGIVDEAKAILNIVSGMKGTNLSTGTCVDIFRGSKAKAIIENGWNTLNGYGTGRSWDKDDSQRLVDTMITNDVLGQDYIVNGVGFTNSYLIPGKNATKLRSGFMKLTMVLDHSPTAPSKKPGARAKAGDNQEFDSTYVSSPIPPTKGRARQAAKFQSTQPDDDGFMPVRDGNNTSTAGGKKRKSDGVIDDTGAPKRKKVAAQPIGITADSIRAGLNEYDLDVLERFLKDAKRVRGDLMNERSLRVESVFTDTELSWMGVKLPCSMNELVAMPQIQDKDRLRMYGSKFLPITQKYSNEKLENYEGTQFTQGPPTDSQDFQGFLEDDFDDDDFEDDDQDGEESRFFSNTGRSQGVTDFSARMAAASQAKSTTTTKKATTRAPRRGSSGSRGRGGKKFFKGKFPGGAKGTGKGKGAPRAGKGGRGGGGAGSTGARPMVNF